MLDYTVIAVQKTVDDFKRYTYLFKYYRIGNRPKDADNI